MIFAFRYWDDFCRKLQEKEILSIPAREVTWARKSYLVLKHDVETDVSKAYKIASIESRYGHRGSYYVQAYLLENKENVQMLKQMQAMGHEITYHHDVMDACKGNLQAAIQVFEQNKALFERNGFSVKTVCQHGNPIVERVGYHSNRDFFRSRQVRERYPEISDIMVDYQEKHSENYRYFSDAGRRFQWIYDPVNNDIVNSDEKNMPYEDLNMLLEALEADSGNVISIHPHRWTKSETAYLVKTWLFKWIRATAKQMAKVPFIKRIMSRYYYLAKKI